MESQLLLSSQCVPSNIRAVTSDGTQKMGLGPWYRLGLTLGNCLILVAIIETGLTFNTALHGMGEIMVFYMYGPPGKEPRHAATDLKDYPHYSFFVILYVLQLLFDALLWLVIVCKINKHIVLVWNLLVFSKTLMEAYLGIAEEWGQEFEGAIAINFILAFLWGSVLFLFKLSTGIQVLVHIVTDEDPGEKIHPVGQGFGPIKEYYVEHLKQLSVILLVSEITMNIYRALNYPTTAFLQEAEWYLEYEAPKEYGRNISFITVIINTIGLILLTYNSLTMRRSWIGAYVITILIHFVLFLYVVIDWTGATAHPQMFNGFVFVSLTHLIYKVFILYVYLKC